MQTMHLSCINIRTISKQTEPMSRISVRGIPTDVHNEIIRTKVEIPNSTLYSITCIIIDDPSIEDGKGRRANQAGLERQLPSNTETSSSESASIERKGAARRLTHAREPEHLMRLSHPHLTRQSREA
jgi:hypothetical protein